MNRERLLKVLQGPHISEKATIVAGNGNQVVFRVSPDATKPEIKAAVEQLFEVSVSSVRTLVQKGKTNKMKRRIEDLIDPPGRILFNFCFIRQVLQH